MRIAFLNPQGNFDPEDRYWTEHPDFGGQLVYVKEVAIAMAREGIEVDIITRRVRDKDWPGFESEIDTYPGIENLKIIRIPFGGDGFVRKEVLWPHLEEYVEGICDYYHQTDEQPDFVTTHYGDGGLAGALLAEKLELPFSFTGHSLGAQKLDKLGANKENIERLDSIYNFTNRIPAERISMSHSAFNIVSTNMERFKQYSHQLYQGAVDVQNDDRFRVIPPGVNTRIFYPGTPDENIKIRINQSLKRDISPERQNLPGIVASSRLDPKKNHLGLIKAFAQDQELQSKANLSIFVRGMDNPFEDYDQLKGLEREVMLNILGIINDYNLKGKVSFVNLTSQQELADAYRYFAHDGGIFALTALYEPFGLAPLEAAACGLPVVVTRNGGPSESFKDESQEYGVLVDPESEQEIAKGLLRLIGNKENWQRFQTAGIKRIKTRYTWEKTADGYINAIKDYLTRDNVKIEKVTNKEMELKELTQLYWGKGDNR